MKKEQDIVTKKRKNQIDMINGPILSKMLRFAFPVMAASILQLLFNAADIIVVGRFAGDNALAAVGSTTSLISLMVNMFIGLSVGANVLAARHFGAHKGRELNETLHTAIALSLVSGVALAAMGIIFAEPILRLMQSPENVLKLAAVYLRIYFLGMPATMVYNFGSAMLRAKGDTKRPLYFLTIAGVINVTLNLLFVIKLDMSVAGVAAATAISQCFSAVMIIWCLSREEDDFRFEFKKLKIRKRMLIGILQVGLPAGVQGVLFSLSNVLIQSAINTFGDVAIAGSSAASNIENFVYFSMNAFYQAAISFTSQNVGAGKYDRVRPIMKRAVACAGTVGLIMGLSAYFAGPLLLGIYSKSSDVIAEGMIRLTLICAPYALCGMMDAMVGMLRGLGYSIAPLIVSLVGACLSRIVWITILFNIMDSPPIELIYISYPVTWTVTLLAHFVC
ncbi:MAG: MATE family efflux transporter, partial [Firmicutes bacterium]|nr:MATE family efflux transporter [Bacillota bacterium]